MRQCDVPWAVVYIAMKNTFNLFYYDFMMPFIVHQNENIVKEVFELCWK